MNTTMCAWVDERLAAGATADEIYAELGDSMLEDDQRAAVWRYATGTRSRFARGWTRQAGEDLHRSPQYG